MQGVEGEGDRSHAGLHGGEREGPDPHHEHLESFRDSSRELPPQTQLLSE